MNKRYAICYNSEIENSIAVMRELKLIFDKYDNSYDILEIDKLKTGYELAFIIGGDGTILKAARFYAKSQTPIFGINLGRLGFLSQAIPENLEYCFNKIMNNDYKVENRMMLKSGNHIALNDFVIKGNSQGRTNRLALLINGMFVCEYLADGLIISTPTGSTAYNMAAGGSIITPDCNVIAITPICPHTFSARPIVVCASDEIKVVPCENSGFKVAADGQVIYDINSEVIITKAEETAKLALLSENEFFTVLRNKLHWGIAPTKK